MVPRVAACGDQGPGIELLIADVGSRRQPLPPLHAGLILWAQFAHGMNVVALAPVLPLISEEYDISHTSGGLLLGVVMLIQGVFGLAGGAMVGRLGLKRVYTLGWIMSGAGTLTVLSPDFHGLLALRVVYGLGTAMLVPATGPLLMSWFRPRHLPVMTSLSVAALTVGTVVSLSTAAPLAGAIGWERGLGVFGAVALAGAVVWLFWGGTREEEGVRPAVTPFVTEVWSVLRSPTVLLLGFALSACFAQYITLSGWLPTFYHETREMSLTKAGFLVSVLPFVGIFAVLLGGFLPLKIKPKRLFLIVPGAMVGLGGLGSFLIDSTALTYLSVVVLGLGTWLCVPTLLTIPTELPGMTSRRMGLYWGWTMTVTGFSNFASPLVVGAMRDSLDSFTPGFLVFALLSWFLFVAGFLLPRGGPQGSEGPASAA